MLNSGNQLFYEISKFGPTFPTVYGSNGGAKACSQSPLPWATDSEWPSLTSKTQKTLPQLQLLKQWGLAVCVDGKNIKDHSANMRYSNSVNRASVFTY